MPKTKLSDILKNGDNFQIKKLDLDSDDFKRMVESVQEEKERLKNQKKIDSKLFFKKIG